MKAAEWISVNEGLPEVGKYVACLRMYNKTIEWVTRGRVVSTLGRWSVKAVVGMTLDTSIPTHWVSLPEPPLNQN